MRFVREVIFSNGLLPIADHFHKQQHFTKLQRINNSELKILPSSNQLVDCLSEMAFCILFFYLHTQYTCCNIVCSIISRECFPYLTVNL